MIGRLRVLCLVTLSVAGIFWAARSSAATLFLSPAGGTYQVGQSLSLTLHLNAQGREINAGQGTITWTPDTLQLTNIGSAGSIFHFWPIAPATSGLASAVFSGGVSSPWYNGSSGTVLNLTFTALAAGPATVSLSQASIRANDGQGTELYSGQGAGTYTILPKTPATLPSPDERSVLTISSASHPNQSAWYTATNVVVSWTGPSGYQGASYSLTSQPDTVPPEQVVTTGRSASLAVDSDGRWYVHLRGKYPSGWSTTTHYTVQVDRTAPDPFTPVITQDRGPTDPTPVLTFTATDATSGIADYTYQVDDGPAQPTVSPVNLEGLPAGHHQVVVTAYDQAGNTRQGSAEVTTDGYTAPTLTKLASPLVVLDRLIVRGLANAGDTVSVYVNQQLFGRTVVGPVDQTSLAQGIAVRLPWSITSDRLFRPGTYQVTATAQTSAGPRSAPSDPQSFRVIGQAWYFNGRPVATWSVVAPLAILLLALLVLILAVLLRAGIALRVLHGQKNIAAQDLEVLRGANQRQTISRQQLDAAIEHIEEDLDGQTPATSIRKRPGKRPR